LLAFKAARELLMELAFGKLEFSQVSIFIIYRHTLTPSYIEGFVTCVGAYTVAMISI
jgi:hypothetical protein